MRLFVCALALAISAGCAPLYYAPNAVNLPAVGAKGEGTVAAQIGDYDELDVQASYSPLPGFGLIGSGVKANVEGSGSDASGKGHLVEVGAGYYQRMGSRFLWDAYGIVGAGGVENHFSGRDISAGFTRVGVQPSGGFRWKYFDVFGAARVVALRYRDIAGDAEQSQYLKSAGTQWLFEPVITLRGGYDVIKAQLQIGRSFNLTDKEFRQDDDTVTVGIVYRFKKK